MSKQTHTPGPWEIGKYTNFTGYSIWAEGRGCIAERWYDKEQDQPYGNEIDANARLIAAAPDLLEALCEALDRLEWVREKSNAHSIDSAIEQARAAIAKAQAPRLETKEDGDN